MPVSAYVSANSVEENSWFARRVVEENVEQLQEIQPGVYVMTVYEYTRGLKHPSLSIKVNNEPKRINLNNAVVYCNASEAKMITRKTKLKNELLSFLLFDFARAEKELYTPEEMIYGEYGFIESAKQ